MSQAADPSKTNDASPAARARIDALVRIEQFVPAPPSLAYRCFTDPALVTAWWGGREGGCIEAQAEPKVGGCYRFVYRQQTGNLLITSGRYERLDPPRQLVMSWKWGEPESDAEESQVTVEFLVEGEGTRVVVNHARLVTEEARSQHAEGWIACLGFLAKQSPGLH